VSRTCHQCGESEHHAPSCPEMFWPDGHPRGQLRNPLPLPPFIKDPEARARFRFADPGGDWSPLKAELAGIFAGVDHVLVREDDDDQAPE
jgi:hypothetical protein